MDASTWLELTGLLILHPKYEIYVYNKFLSYGLNQLINFNTRNSNILDLMFTNNTLIISSISPTSAFEFDAHVSDYFAIYSDLVIPDNYLTSGNLTINVKSCDLPIIKVILLVLKLIFCYSTGLIFYPRAMTVMSYSTLF